MSNDSRFLSKWLVGVSAAINGFMLPIKHRLLWETGTNCSDCIPLKQDAILKLTPRKR